MGCPEHDCCASHPENAEISFPGTFDHNTPWKFYNHLIGQVPEGIKVLDYCIGAHWSYVEAECGMGVSYTVKGGAGRAYTRDLRGIELREMAELAKSWCFAEATLGVAALNAWYARRELLDPLGARYDETVELPDGAVRKQDAFGLYLPQMAGKKVVVVGHFPHLERVAEVADLTILERNCSQEHDTPDPACEYVVPSADFAFITGTTITNKTAPRLLDLSKNATTVMTGPSVVPSEFLFDWGVETIASSVVADPEKTRFAVKNGAGKFFGEALQMMTVTRK